MSVTSTGICLTTIICCECAYGCTYGSFLVTMLSPPYSLLGIWFGTRHILGTLFHSQKVMQLFCWGNYQIDWRCLTTLRCCGCAYGCILTMILHILLDKHLEIYWYLHQATVYAVLCSGWGCRAIQNGIHINVKHIESVWQPSYAMDMSMGTSLSWYRLSCYGDGESWILLGNQPQCKVMTNALDSFVMAPTSMLIILYVLDNHHMLWMCLWMHLWKFPCYHAITSLHGSYFSFVVYPGSWSWTPFHRCYEVVLLRPY